MHFPTVTKILFGIPILALVQTSYCQVALVSLPDSLNKHYDYYSPTYTAKAKAGYKGVLEIGQPFDSLEWGHRLQTKSLGLFQKPELAKFEKSLLVIWDSLQEWECLEFMTSPKGKAKFSPAKNSPVYYENKEVSGRDVKTIPYQGMPVYILNNTDSDFVVKFPKYGLRLFQEALDKTNKWRRIEEALLPPQGYARPTTSRLIRPGQYILTTVYKYKGNYLTLLRLCFETGEQKFYSLPYTGSINYSQFKK